MRALKYAVLALVVALVAAQFVQPARTNPATSPEATFQAVAHPPERVNAILNRSCGPCHSNQTAWPWYSRVAPVSWLVASDVSEGRAKLNFSKWNIYSPEMSALRAKAICQHVRSGDMPPWYYRPLHPRTGLSADEIAAVCSMAGR